MYVLNAKAEKQNQRKRPRPPLFLEHQVGKVPV